jgi:predicted DNA-binding transcriptional regulator AlpA
MGEKDRHHHPPRLISRKQARHISGLSERSQTRTPDFPRPVEMSAGRVGLVEDEVVAWVEGRIAARDKGGANHTGDDAPPGA